jgi:hypothetical protein
LKNSDGSLKGLFDDAERISPPPGLWRSIEARAGLESGATGPAAQGAEPMDMNGEGAESRDGSWMRLAASVALAAGLLGLGMFLKDRIVAGNAATAAAVQSATDTVAMAQSPATPKDMDSEIVDPELLGWHADLGEMDETADEAEEVL